MKKLKIKKLKWIGSDDDLPFNYTWKAKNFVIEFIEGRGGEDGGDGYLLTYGKREIEYFSKLSTAKKVAQLIYNG